MNTTTTKRSTVRERILDGEFDFREYGNGQRHDIHTFTNQDEMEKGTPDFSPMSDLYFDVQSIIEEFPKDKRKIITCIVSGMGQEETAARVGCGRATVIRTIADFRERVKKYLAN